MVKPMLASNSSNAKGRKGLVNVLIFHITRLSGICLFISSPNTCFGDLFHKSPKRDISQALNYDPTSTTSPDWSIICNSADCNTAPRRYDWDPTIAGLVLLPKSPDLFRWIRRFKNLRYRHSYHPSLM